jgi:hypothetical protein
MPKTEATRPPGPFTAADKVERVGFRFDEEGRRILSEMLPPGFRMVCPIPDISARQRFVNCGRALPSTIAEWLIGRAEMEIDSRLSTLELDPDARPANPANFRAAIRSLRQALEPFVRGWVDAETANLFDWHHIDSVLAQRDKQLASIKRPRSLDLRQRDYMCARLGAAARMYADHLAIPFTDKEIARFVAQALDLPINPKIKHPTPMPILTGCWSWSSSNRRVTFAPSRGVRTGTP